MEYENDFVGEQLIEIEIEGRKFSYKPITAGDENDWLNDIMMVQEGSKTPSINWSAYNRKKLQNIQEVPYSKDLIKKILGVEKEWKELSLDQRYNLLGKLKPGIFDKIVKAIKKIDEPDEDALKN